MPVELVRDIINYEKLIGEGSSQTMVNGDIVLGERNPEFAKILNMGGKALILSSEVIDDKVLVEGKMFFEILYASTDENVGIYKVNATSNFNHTLQIPGALPKMSCKVSPEIEHMEHELISNRKIKVNAVINIKSTVYEKDTVESIIDIKGQDIQLLKDSARINEYVAENNAQTIIKGKIDVPENMGEVKSVLMDNVHIHKKDVLVQGGKIVVNACALVNLMYEVTGSTNICQAQQDIAFTHEMNINDVKPDMKCDVSFKIGDLYEDIKENENGERKSIEVEVVVDISAKLYMDRDIQTIVDAYSPMERYEIEKQNVKTMSYFGENNDSQTVKEKVVLPQEVNPVNEIKHITTNPVITDVKMVEEKILLEGVIGCCVIYSEAVENGGMASYTEEIPFKSGIDMPGARIDMMPEANANVENLAVEKISDKEFEIKIVLECSAKVYAKSSVDVVKAVEEAELPENIKNMPSITIYIVQVRDTLWKIAKKYCTTIDDIVSMNELQDTDNIQPGTKILIPKKMFMK